ncbi:MAG: LacI family DNA-binding transcriptional regulator [Clostridia bacterium]|nr:LacI family DNA-binding transcriptional regulator [Clostridia bacterium]
MAQTKRVTLQDIARQTGYSINTVSHALRGKADISEQTSARIRDVARRMGYTANQVASSLRSGRTHIFAVVLGGMSNPFYGIMADAIQDAAQAAGYSVMIMCSRDDAELELRLVEQAIARCVDGILLFPTGRSGPTIARLRAAGMPFVLMSRYLNEGEADSVVCDEAQGAYLATRHLIEAGRRKLAYISSSTVVFSSQRRMAGFHRACDEAGIPASDRCVYVASMNLMSGPGQESWHAALVGKLLALRHEGFDGLFVFCDVEAWHALDAMQKSGRFGANDFGIASFDNIEGELSFPIPLCSVGYDFGEMTRAGIELLRGRIHGDARPPQIVVRPVSLICRGSCRRGANSQESTQLS